MKSFSQGLDALQAGQWPDADARFAEAIDANEDNAEYHLAQGVARVLAERFPEAEKDLKRALNLKHNDFETKLWLAACYFMVNNPAEAAKLFSHGGQDTHQYAETVHIMARTYMDSRYRGGYFDMETRKRIETKEPVRKDFPKAAAAFVERHRIGGAAAEVTQDKATAALRAGKFADALIEIERLQKEHPDDLNLLAMHAEAALGVGDALTARHEYTRLLTIDPFIAAHYAGRARAAAMVGDVPRAKTDWDQARKLDASIEKAGIPKELESALKSQPPEKDQIAASLEHLQEQSRADAPGPEIVKATENAVRVQNCHRLRADETYQDKLRELLAATRSAPASADGLANLGEFLYQQATQVRGESVEPRASHQTYRLATKESLATEMQRAEASLDAALQMQPNHIKALTYKAACLMHRRRWDQAEELVKKALSLQPESPELLMVLSDILDHAANVKSAKAATLREVNSWSDLSYIYWRWPSQAELEQAEVYDRQAEELWKLASKHMEAAAQAAHGTAKGFYYEGVIARRKKDAAAARAAFEKAVQLDPSIIQAHDQLAAIYSGLGMVKQAHEAQSAATNLVHTTAGPMLRLAWLETSRTARKGAREASQQAWALDAADPRCAAYLGVTEFDAEKYDQAAAHFRAALALTEARARMHGQTLVRDGKGRINDVDLGVALAIQLRLAETYRAKPDTKRADEICERITALQDRVDENQLRRNLLSGMLPDPGGDQTRLPELDPAAAYFAHAHVQLGNSALGRSELDKAESHFRAVNKLQSDWPFTLPGRERFYVPASWARLGSIKVLAARGQIEEARQMLRREGWPGELPKSLRCEIEKVEQELEKRR